MRNSLTLVIIGTFLLSFLAGCTAPAINNEYAGLDKNETKLLSIQDETTSQITKLTDELQKTDLDFDQIRFLASETSKFIKDKVDQVEELAESVKNAKLINDTVYALESAERLVKKVKEIASELQLMNRDAQSMAEEAKKVAAQEIEQLQKSLDGYKLRLEGYKDKFNNLREDLLNPDNELTEDTNETNADPTNSETSDSEEETPESTS